MEILIFVRLFSLVLAVTFLLSGRGSDITSGRKTGARERARKLSRSRFLGFLTFQTDILRIKRGSLRAFSLTQVYTITVESDRERSVLPMAHSVQGSLHLPQDFLRPNHNDPRRHLQPIAWPKTLLRNTNPERGWRGLSPWGRQMQERKIPALRQ